MSSKYTHKQNVILQSLNKELFEDGVECALLASDPGSFEEALLQGVKKLYDAPMRKDDQITEYEDHIERLKLQVRTLFKTKAEAEAELLKTKQTIEVVKTHVDQILTN